MCNVCYILLADSLTVSSLSFVAKLMPLSQYFLSGRYFSSISLRSPKNCSNTGEVKHSTRNPFFPLST